MPLNSIPATTTVAALEEKRVAARRGSAVHVEFIGGLVPGNAADVLTGLMTLNSHTGGAFNYTSEFSGIQGTSLPVHLEMTVPVSNAIPVVFDQPVKIPLADRGLGPVVAKLRAALGPIISLVRQMPDRFVIIPQ